VVLGAEEAAVAQPQAGVEVAGDVDAAATPFGAGNTPFTPLSRSDNGDLGLPADTEGEMESTGRILFVALVTCYLLGRILGGAGEPAEVVIYGVTAAFGLEYLVASWGGLWQRG
jgi:hypothetical protein